MPSLDPVYVPSKVFGLPSIPLPTPSIKKPVRKISLLNPLLFAKKLLEELITSDLSCPKAITFSVFMYF